MSQPDNTDLTPAEIERIKEVTNDQSKTIRAAFDVEPGMLFDAIRRVNGDCSVLGQRLVSVMMTGDIGLSDIIGLATYGITMADAGLPHKDIEFMANELVEVGAGTARGTLYAALADAHRMGEEGITYAELKAKQAAEREQWALDHPEDDMVF